MVTSRSTSSRFTGRTDLGFECPDGGTERSKGSQVLAGLVPKGQLETGHSDRLQWRKEAEHHVIASCTARCSAITFIECRHFTAGCMQFQEKCTARTCT